MSEEAQGLWVGEDLVGMFSTPWFWLVIAGVIGLRMWQDRHEHY